MSYAKQDRIPWKESNLALIGSELDHKIKAAAADGEDQWDGIGEGEGKRVWRIEQFKVVAWPTEYYGKFHVGDSYIVLNTYLKDDGSDKLYHDVHIWIGKESSQDEYGTAAYKMVEADDKLRGSAVQHREVQGHESSLFQSYFDHQLTYLEGGVDSGFNIVEPTVDTPQLYKIKGSSFGGSSSGMSLTQVPLSSASLNSGDSFILVANKGLVWVWHGESANPGEKAKSVSLGESMCTEGTVAAMEQGMGDEEHSDFWNYLGGYTSDIAPADDNDDQVEEFTPTLYKLEADASPEQVATGEPVKIGYRQTANKLPKDSLQDDHVYLLDGGWDIMVWIGSEAVKADKVVALTLADAFCKTEPRTTHLPITMVKSGYETSDFNEYFQ